MSLIESVLIFKPNVKLDNHERVLSYLLDKFIDPKLGQKAESIFLKYLDQRDHEYYTLVAFVVSKNSFFNLQA